jgi:hypothetical protein
MGNVENLWVVSAVMALADGLEIQTEARPALILSSFFASRVRCYAAWLRASGATLLGFAQTRGMDDQYERSNHENSGRRTPRILCAHVIDGRRKKRFRCDGTSFVPGVFRAVFRNQA